VLRQIVTHVYLAGEEYESDRATGFLGVKMVTTAVRLDSANLLEDAGAPAVPGKGNDAKENNKDDNAHDADEEPAQMGVVITECIPGFIGYRMLREGDVIVGIQERPGLKFAEDSQTWVERVTPFGKVVKSTAPGHTLHFHVLRRGRLIKVPVPLDAMPDSLSKGGVDSLSPFERNRRERADAYWQTFASKIREIVG
jgi:hypothetical protein